MKLYKATKDGQVEMTPEEESEIREFWAANDAERSIPPKNLETVEELIVRLDALEAEVSRIKKS